MAAINWKNPVSGDWFQSSNWLPGAVPGGGDDVTIAGAGNFSVAIRSAAAARSITIASAGATLADSAALTLGGTLVLDAGAFSLLAGGRVVGGTIAEDGGRLVAAGGTLSGVTLHGVLDLGSAGATLGVVNGITLAGAGGSGPGTVNLTGSGSYLAIDAPATLDNATIAIGGVDGFARLGFDNLAVASGTLTLGVNLTLAQAGQFASVRNAAVHPGDAIVNRGAIVAGLYGGRMYIYGGSFANRGSILVSNGDTLRLTSDVLSNTGSIGVADGGTLYLTPMQSWSNGGTISETGGTLVLGGEFSSATLASVRRSGGSLAVSGTVDNAGAVLSLGTGSALGAIALSGTIVGGTIADGGGGLAGRSGAVLSGVVYQGTLDLSAANGQLGIANGITLTGPGGIGPGSINLTGSNAALVLQNPMTLDNAAIRIGGGFGPDRIVFQNEAAAAGTLTLGPALTITQTGMVARLNNAGQHAGDAIVNRGVIIAASAGGQFNVYGSGGFTNRGTIAVGAGDSFRISTNTFANAGTVSLAAGATLVLAPTGSWSNSGAITATNATLSLGGSFSTATLLSVSRSGGVLTVTGRLDNAGATLALGAGAAFGSIGLSGTVVGGTVRNAGGGLAALGGTLSGVVYQGTLDLGAAGAGLAVANGISLQGAGGVGPGSVNLTGNGASLLVTSATTLDSASIAIGSAAGDTLGFGNNGTAGGTLTIGPGVAIVQSGRLATIRNYNQRGGDAVVNQGTISAAVAGGQFYIAGGNFTNAGLVAVDNGDTLHVTAATFSNLGTLVVGAGGNLVMQSASFANLAQSTLSGGSFEVDAGATLQMTASAAIATDNATIVLNGVGGTIEAVNPVSGVAVALDSSLSAIGASGTLRLLGGRSFNATANGGAFSDAGTLQLGGGSFASATLAITAGGTLAGTGAVQAAIGNAGRIEAAAGTLVLAGAVAGSGVLVADAGAVLAVTAGGDMTGTVSGAGTLRVDGAAAFRFDTGSALQVASVVQSGTVTVGSGGSQPVVLANMVGDTYAMDGLAAAPATLSASGAGRFVNAGSFVADGDSAQVALGFLNIGTVSVGSGTLAFLRGLVNNGHVSALSGTLSVNAAVSGNGRLDVGSGGALRLLHGATAGQTVDFLTGPGTLDLRLPASFLGRIAGFHAGDQIDLLGATATGASFAGGILTVANGAGTVASLHITGAYSTASFSLASDQHGGTLIGYHG